MKQYLDLLENILKNGIEKQSARENMPNTLGISHAVISHDLQNGFPLLTTKKMYWKGVVHELLWFLRGDTNIKYLVNNDVYIWNSDCYGWYLKKCKQWSKMPAGECSKLEYDHARIPLTFDRFIALIKDLKLEQLRLSDNYTLGDLGKVYGYTWRKLSRDVETPPNRNNKITNLDQVVRVIDELKNNPTSRYHIINAWDIKNFDECALMPCHLLYQFIVRPLNDNERRNILKENLGEENAWNANLNELDWDRIDAQFNIPKYYLDLNMYQRSCDTFLGVPFNIASMSLLNIIFAKACNMIPGVINWIGGDTHIYLNHLEQAKKQLTREPYPLPTMKINKEINNIFDIENLSINDFELINYSSHPKIKAELSTGLIKS